MMYLNWTLTYDEIMFCLEKIYFLNKLRNTRYKMKFTFYNPIYKSGTHDTERSKLIKSYLMNK